MKKQKLDIIIGCIILVINFVWAFIPIDLLYRYHFTNTLWFYMYPNWLLITNALIGFVGITIGINVIMGKMGIKSALKIELPILALAILISYIVPYPSFFNT